MLGQRIVVGPQFTEADFDRAYDVLDLCLQNYYWQPRENKLDAASVVDAMKCQGITLALALALVKRLIALGVLTKLSRTRPAGHFRMRGSDSWHHHPFAETTVSLETTRERWYSHLAQRRRERRPPESSPGHSDVSSERTSAVPVDLAAAPGPASSKVKGSRDKKLEARDRWIYERCMSGMAYGVVKFQLRPQCARKGWRMIASIQGIRNAAVKYALRHDMPVPPSRQNL
jgi:hypothetical protein